MNVLHQQYRKENPAAPDADAGLSMVITGLQDSVVADIRGKLLMLSKSNSALPCPPHELIVGKASGEEIGGGLDALPDTAQVCSCNNVSKGELCDAIAAGCTSLGALKKATKASTTCGGCGPLVKQILDCERHREHIAAPAVRTRHRRQEKAERGARPEAHHRNQAAAQHDDGRRTPGDRLGGGTRGRGHGGSPRAA
jgi:NAD(P)H-nitrite reductase large subunit